MQIAFPLWTPPGEEAMSCVSWGRERNKNKTQNEKDNDNNNNNNKQQKQGENKETGKHMNHQFPTSANMGTLI